MDIALFVKALGALFAIMNPFVALPMFLSLTTGYDTSRQKGTAVRVVIYSTIMAAVILVSGTAILGFFGVGVNDFRVAGGLVLLFIALGMLNGGSAAHSGSEQEKENQAAAPADTDVSFYPLTFPMLLGPGTITTIIVFTGHGTGVTGYLSVAAALVVVLVLLFVVLWFAPAIGHRMSENLQVIMTRLMGMILAAIAVQMMIAGVQALIPAMQG